MNIDLGLIDEPEETGNISGLVWADNNENGLRDAGEPGRNGINVRLFQSDGTEIGMTTTAILGGKSGSYQFADIVVGDYYIKFDLNQGLLATSPNVGGDDAIDSDVTGSNGPLTTDTYALTSTGIANVDLGIVEEPEVGDIAGRVWNDENENGIREGNEVGVNGITVKLINSSDEVIAQTVTRDIGGVAGIYQFPFVVTGTYHLLFEPGIEYLATLPDAGGDDTIDSDVTGANGPFTTSDFTLTSSGIMNLDLGIVEIIETGEISGRLWSDENSNGIREGTEPGVNGLNVILYNNNGVEVASTVSSTLNGIEGRYLFENIEVGDYYIRFELTSAYASTIGDVGNDDTIDSDITGANGVLTTATFTLTAAGVMNIDAGLISFGDIAGRVFLDANGNGIKNTGEPGRNGVMVILYNEQDVEIDRRTTAIIGGQSGSYSFSSIIQGSYYIQFEVEDGFFATTPNIGSDDTIDSDVTDANGPFTTDLFVVPGELNHIDLGIVELGSISGRAWADNNNNGIRDAGEPGRNGITVKLYNTGGNEIASTSTAIVAGQSGSYSFNDVLAGDYYVGFIIGEGLMATIADAGNDDSVDSDVTGDNGILTTDLFSLSNAGIENLDLGIVESAGGMISGRAWDDLDGDGIREGGEDLGAGIPVDLILKGSGIVASTTTLGNGTYMFMDIPQGTYYVAFGLPSSNHSPTVPNNGSDDTDSDVTGANGPATTDDIIIGSSTAVVNIDCGYYEEVVIGDLVWEDANKNGLFDNGESGLDGITVTLYTFDGTVVDIVSTSSGIYNFTGVSPGLYYIKFELPAGASFTVPDAGSNGLDSDVTNQNGFGTTDVFEVFSGESEDIFDAGIIFGDGSIGDFIWLDLDGDGLQGVNESGINGIPVSIFSEGGALINSTVSSASDGGQDGFYTFGALDPGNYYVVVDLPDSLIFTDANAGPDNLDSDITSSIAVGSSDLIAVTNQPITGVDIGVLVPAEIGDFVWEDINKNGIQDDGEPGIKDVEVILFTSTGTEVTFAFTDIQGQYSLEGIKPGMYFIEVLLPSAEFQFTSLDEGSDDDLDSDVDAAGVTSTFTVTHGAKIDNIDAGIYNSNTIIGGIVWMDDNKDGLRNENHLLEGVGVNLIDEDGRKVKTTLTNHAGRYAFSDVPAGRYYVKVVPNNPIFEFTQTNTGIDNGINSDVGVDGKSALLKINPGNAPIRIDAGIVVSDGLTQKEEYSPTYLTIEAKALPNLTDGRSTLELTNTEGEVNVYVFDRNGALQYTRKTEYNSGIPIDLSHLKQGTYYIKAVTARGAATTRVIKF
jgi:hypothetical protein